MPRPYEPILLKSLPADCAALEFSAAGGKQYAYYLGRGPGAPLPEVLWVVFGGNAMRALDWLDIVDKADRTTAGILLVEYPGYGQNEGRPGRRSIVETTEAAYGALAARLGAPSAQLDERVRVLGVSLGAAAALEFASRRPAQRVLLISPFTSLMDMARRSVGAPLCWLLYDRFDNRARLAELASRPAPPRIDLFHGDDDEIVPVQMGRELARLHPAMIRYHEVPGAGHNDMLDYHLHGNILAALSGKE